MMQQYRSNSYLFGGNAPYVEEMYEAYLDNPGSVPDNWRASQVRNMGVVEGSPAATDNDWEAVKRGGDAASPGDFCHPVLQLGGTPRQQGDGDTFGRQRCRRGGTQSLARPQDKGAFAGKSSSVKRLAEESTPLPFWACASPMASTRPELGACTGAEMLPWASIVTLAILPC